MTHMKKHCVMLSPAVVLQDAVQAKGRGSAALQQAQQQQDQTAQHVGLLTQQLSEERQQVAALSANLDSLQAEHNRYKTQVSIGALAIAARAQRLGTVTTKLMHQLATACIYGSFWRQTPLL